MSESSNTKHNEAAVKDAITKLKELGTNNCLEGLRILRDVLCDEDAPIQLAIDGGCVQALINLMRVPNVPVQSDAIWCLTNIASGTHDQTGCVLEAVPELLTIIGGDEPSLGEQACWTLGNIAGDSDDFRAILVKNGAVLPVVRLLCDGVGGVDWRAQYEERERVQLSQYGGGSDLDRRQAEAALEAADLTLQRSQTAAWALSNLARGSTSATVFLETGAMPLLISLIDHPHTGLAGEIWWLFTFLTAKKDEAVQYLLDEGIIAAIAAAVDSSLNSNDIASIPLIRCLGNLSSGPELWIDSIVAVPTLLLALCACVDLESSHRAVLKESVWVLANLLGGSEQQRIVVLNSGSLQRIVPALYCDYNDVQREALFALRHACQTTEVVLRLVNRNNQQGGGGDSDMLGLLGQLIEFLRVPDEEVMVGALEVLQAMIYATPATKATVMWAVAQLDILEALEKMQYGPGGKRLKEVVGLLIEELEGAAAEADEGGGASFQNMGSFSAPPRDESGHGGASRGVSNKPAWMTK